MKQFVVIVTCAIACLYYDYGCGLNVYPVSKDVDLGKTTVAQINANPKTYPILQGHEEVKQYVRTVATTILQSPEIKYRGTFAYTIEIIHDDKTVNAFCTPGGYIYVYTGLLKFIDNEATLAGVLAHEIAHAELRHATKHLTAANGSQELLNLGTAATSNSLVHQAASLAGNMALLSYSRSEEAEADANSFKYLKSTTAYYPGAIKFFFEKMLRTQKQSGGAEATVNKFMSDHPLSDDRLDAIDSLLHQNKIGPPSERSLHMIPFKVVQAELP